MIVVGFIIVAAIATLARAILTADQAGGQVPWRTFAINVTGAFLLGLVLASSWWENPVIATTAGLGSLTTFSTVAAETAALVDDDHRGTAIAYVLLTVVVGIVLAAIGLSIGELL